MLNQMESKWRYIIALLLGLIFGLAVGCTIATVVMYVWHGENPTNIIISDLWFTHYPKIWRDMHSERFNIALAISIVPAIFSSIFFLTSVHRIKLNQYGAAHWQTPREMRKNNMVTDLNNNGFVYGKLGNPKSNKNYIGTSPDKFPHLMMVAPTGSGKGVGFVIPNLLHFKGSAIVLDIKGENFKATSIHREQVLKQKILYFSPYDIKHGTHRYNPLQKIANIKNIDRRYSELNMLSYLFLSTSSESARSFLEAGRPLFIACCLYAIEKGEPTIEKAIKYMGGGADKVTSYLEYAADTNDPRVSRLFQEMSGVPDKTLGSYISVMMGAGLSAWNDPFICKATSASDFNFDTLRKNAQTLYIVMTPSELKTMSPLVRLLFADAIASLQKNEPKPDEKNDVMFLLDEFDQLGRMDIILDAIKTIRSYRGRFFIITQSISGLDDPKLYGQANRLALQAGAGLQIYMTPSDANTAEVLSKALGKYTVIHKTSSGKNIKNWNDTTNISRSAQERPLISSEELLSFSLDKVMILPAGQPPIIGHHIKFYKDSKFMKLYQAQNGKVLPFPNNPTEEITTLDKPGPSSTLKQNSNADEFVEDEDLFNVELQEIDVKSIEYLSSKITPSNKKKRSPKGIVVPQTTHDLEGDTI